MSYLNRLIYSPENSSKEVEKNSDRIAKAMELLKDYLSLLFAEKEQAGVDQFEAEVKANSPSFGGLIVQTVFHRFFGKRNSASQVIYTEMPEPTRSQSPNSEDQHQEAKVVLSLLR